VQRRHNRLESEAQHENALNPQVGVAQVTRDFPASVVPTVCTARKHHHPLCHYLPVGQDARHLVAHVLQLPVAVQVLLVLECLAVVKVERSTGRLALHTGSHGVKPTRSDRYHTQLVPYSPGRQST